MTALAGLWNFGAAADPARGCDRMLKAQQVYGPDPAAIWPGGDIVLGKRLYKTLPEDMFDRGPVVDLDAARVLVADVRLDNRDDLCRMLDIVPGEARLLSDSALLMKALSRWDEGALDRLVGDFAFALWDGRRQRLLLARDFLGQRPLHYHRGAGFFAFASMPKGLHALPQVPLAVDRQAAADFLALIPESGTESYFEGIGKVQPGHLAIVTRDGLATRKYWNPQIRPLRLSGAPEYAEALREQLDQAVTARLRGGDGRIAAHLSGGLDSSAVASTAARLLAPSGGTVTAFTSVPGENYHGPEIRERFSDEGPLAASVAALYPNMEHVLIRTAGKSPLDSLDRNFFLYERPYLNLCNGVWVDAIRDAARQRRLTVLLGGMMGNMSFSYNGMHLLSRLASHGRLIRLAREAGLLVRNGTRLGTVAAQAAGPFLPPAAWRAINRLRGRFSGLAEISAINPALGGRPELAERAASRGVDLSYRPGADSVEERLWAIGRVDLGNYGKGCLGGWGIDERDPSADRRLIEFCLSVPDEQYLAGGVQRALARRAFADRLPQAVLRETRKGYQAADWHEGLSGARDAAREEIGRLARIPEAAEALDVDRMTGLVENWPTGSWNGNKVMTRYRLALLRGLSAGHFIRKASGSNE